MFFYIGIYSCSIAIIPFNGDGCHIMIIARNKKNTCDKQFLAHIQLNDLRHLRKSTWALGYWDEHFYNLHFA